MPGGLGGSKLKQIKKSLNKEVLFDTYKLSNCLAAR